MPVFHLYLEFVAAVVVLMLLPGPNVALIVANSIRHGTACGLVTMTGTSTAMAVQLGLTALGLSSVLGHFGAWLGWIRWVGVIYLVWLGVAAWRAPPPGPVIVGAGPVSLGKLWVRGFLVSLTNPKTLFFYGALLPQFITGGRSFAGQMGVLAASFLVIALVIDSLWCLLAGWVRGRLASSGRVANRIGGSVLIGAGIGLALARGAKL